MHFVLIHFILSSSTNALFPLVFTFAITIIVIIIRIRKVAAGTKVSVKKTVIFSAYFLAITSFLVYNSLLVGGIPFVYIIPYSVVIIAVVYCSYRYSKRALSFWKLPHGDGGSYTIYAKGGLSIYLLYIAALTIRITINFLFIGSEKFYFYNQQQVLANSTATVIMPVLHTDPATTMLAFTFTDFLLMVGTGLVIGRNARVLKYYYQDKVQDVK
jgi:hypothetical protein